MHSDQRQVLKDVSRLEAVSALGLPETVPPAEIARLVRLTARVLEAPSAAFLLLSEKEFRLCGSFGLQPSLAARSVWPLHWAFLLDAAFAGTLSVDDADRPEPSPESPPEASAFLGASVEDGEGRLLGILAVWDVAPRRWSEAHGVLIRELSETLRDLLSDRLASRRREQDLASSRDELSVILRTMESACTAQDPTGRLVYANDAAARILGFSKAEELLATDPREIVGRYEIIDADRRPLGLEDLPGREALRGNPVTGKVVGYRVKETGEERWSLLNATPVFDGAGRVRLCINVFNDITEIKKAELSLNNHMRFLEGVNRVSGALERTPDVECALPAALGEILEVFDCSRAWLVRSTESDETGFRSGKAGFRIPFSMARTAAGKAAPDIDFIPSEAGFDAIAHACKAAEGPLVFGPGRPSPVPNPEFWKRFMHAGTIKAIQVRPQAGPAWILCLLRPTGQVAWQPHELAMFKDVSSRIATSLGAILLHRDLRRSEEKYRTLFERSLDGIFRCAGDGTILDANPALVSMLGHTDRGGLIGTVQKRLLPAGGEASGLHDQGETFSVELARKDGQSVWVEVSSQPVRRAGGGIAHFEGVVRNINDRKRTEEALKASEEKLRQAQKMEAVGRLAGGVAHDFNNLLTAINGFSDLLLMSVPKEDTRRPHVEEIRKAGARAAALTSQLLSFSRKQVLAPRVMDLNSVVSGMETMLRRLIGENIEFRTSLHPKLAKVVADPNQIEQVILNLILNARDAMPDGGELSVSTENRPLNEADRHQAVLEVPAGEYVLLSVRDTGGGMDEETLKRLFEPFFTTKQKDKGTGLGLSTVYGAVKQANGTITVESSPERGSVFSIYLPASALNSKPEKSRLRERALRSLGGSETILLVEDEDAVRRLVRDVLEVGGYTVLEAPGGEQALELVEKLGKDRKIDLLLTDVVMGGMSGRELAERIKSTRPGTKVLFMSGYTEDAIIRHGVLTAQASFIGKPFSPATLSAKVREVLDRAPGQALDGDKARGEKAPDGDKAPGGEKSPASVVENGAAGTAAEAASI